MINEIANEKATFKWKSINSLVSAAFKKRTDNTRVLYAGVNPKQYDTMVVIKVVELFRGRYFCQETVFNPKMKSIHSTLTSINSECFHKIIPAKEKLHNEKFFPNPQIVAGTSYAREFDGKVFFNTILKDHRNNQGYLTPICDLFSNRKIRNQLKL